MLIILVLLGSSTVNAQGLTVSDEYSLKAAYLYNFLQFVEFPNKAEKDSAASCRICVLGNGELKKSFLPLEGRNLSTAQVHLLFYQSIADIQHCDVVFVPRSSGTSMDDITSLNQNFSGLTVGETDEFLKNGGIIQFVVREKKIRFCINLSAADAKGIHLSSRLLKLAEEVIR